jgi:nickel-dependent lactate racemase
MADFPNVSDVPFYWANYRHGELALKVQLAYGRTGLDVDLPDGHVVHCLDYRSTAPLADPESAVREALARPIDSPPLSELARGRRSVCVLVCDITRPVPNQVLLPPILETLERSGIPRREILLLVATGMHRPNDDGELREMLGSEIVDKYRIENHFGQEREQHTFLGTTPRGVPAWVDSRYVGADLKITTGLIEPHFMAGFSGGRKLICPGIVGLDTVRVWHGPAMIGHPNARCGCLAGNPIHEESTAVARLAGCDFIVNTVIDDKRQILRIVAGDLEAAFLEGAACAREIVTATLAEPVDIVVTTAAGYPLDATYYQAIKGLAPAAEIVKPGGTIILAAEMSEGIGSPSFERLFREHATLEQFMHSLGDPANFTMDQWQLQKYAQARSKAKIRIFGHGLSVETLRGLFIEPTLSVEAAVADVIAEHGPQATIAVIPKGPYVMAEIAA